MRICIICPYVGRGMGGLERVGIDLCNNMESREHEVALVYYGKGKPVGDVNPSVILIDEIELFEAAIDRIIQFNPNVLLGMSSGYRSIYMFKIANQIGVPFCIHESTHYRRFCNEHWATPRKISFEEASIERESICAQAYRIRHVLDHSYKYFSDFIKPQVRIFPNPLNYFSNPKERRESPNTIINVGGLKKVKNIFPLLISFKNLSKKFGNWNLKICGSGFKYEKSYQVAILEYIKKNNLENRIVFTGNVNNMMGEYLTSSIHVITSLDENFGMAVAESMAVGLPTIGFRNSFGVSSLITDGEDGLLVKVEEGYHGIQNALDMLMGNEDLRSQLSQNAFVNSVMFDSKKAYDEWEKIFNESQPYGLSNDRLLYTQMGIDKEKALFARRKSKNLIDSYVDDRI